MCVRHFPCGDRLSTAPVVATDANGNHEAYKWVVAGDTALAPDGSTIFFKGIGTLQAGPGGAVTGWRHLLDQRRPDRDVDRNSRRRLRELQNAFARLHTTASPSYRREGDAPREPGQWPDRGSDDLLHDPRTSAERRRGHPSDPWWGCQ